MKNTHYRLKQLSQYSVLKLIIIGLFIYPMLSTKVSAEVVMPAGTRLLVRMDQSLATKTHKTGQRFTTTLEGDLVVNGTPIAPRGTKVYGRLVEAKKSGRAVGKSSLTIELTDIRINNELRPIMTEPYSSASKGQGRKTLRRAGAGALIGGIVDGGDGAATGAAIGAGLSMISPKAQVAIEQGSLIEFRLSAPMAM